MAYNHYTDALPVQIIGPDDPLLISERVAVSAFLAGYIGGTRISVTSR
jgi:hypothetical protein